MLHLFKVPAAHLEAKGGATCLKTVTQGPLNGDPDDQL